MNRSKPCQKEKRKGESGVDAKTAKEPAMPVTDSQRQGTAEQHGQQGKGTKEERPQ